MTFGQNVKRIRKERKLSLQALSERSAVSFSMLSKIERGEKSPTIRIANQIARALESSLSALVEEPVNANVTIVRKAERKSYLDQHTGISGEIISSIRPDGNIEFYYCRLPEQSATEVLPPYAASVKAYILVDSGAFRLMVNSAAYDLFTGDYILFEPSTEHQMLNIAQEETTLYILIDHGCQSQSYLSPTLSIL